MRNDQIFTPKPIVEKMLDMVGYAGENIRTKTIFEPSFGDGAFLTSIVQRAINFYKENNLTEREFIEILDRIYGIEIDKKYFDKTIDKLDEMLAYEGFVGYDWPNLHNSDALSFECDVKFDMAAINPPYIRIHDLSTDQREKIKDYKFSVGSTDMYIVFFEMCIQNMAPNGKMCFITPNSYFKNTSQKDFRKYLIDNNMVEEIIDFGTYKVFDKISTYAAITLFNMNRSERTTKYTSMKDAEKENYTVSVDLNSFGTSPWAITNTDDTAFLNTVQSRSIKLGDICDVQNGIATNADKVFIVKPDDFDKFEPDILRPIVKASTLESENKIIFPYLWNDEKNKFELMDDELFSEQYPKTRAYIWLNQPTLIQRDMEKDGKLYQYGRSQGLHNSKNKKIAIKHILAPDSKTCDILELDEKTLVYSGIYIVVKNPDDYSTVVSILKSKDFHRYIKLVSKDMSGGYKSFNTKAVKNYKFERGEENE